MEEILNNREDSEFSDYSSDISEDINRPISFESKKYDCSDEKTETDIQDTNGQKQGKTGLIFSFIKKMGLKVKIQN